MNMMSAVRTAGAVAAGQPRRTGSLRLAGPAGGPAGPACALAGPACAGGPVDGDYCGSAAAAGQLLGVTTAAGPPAHWQAPLAPAGR